MKSCWCSVFLNELLLNRFKSQVMYSVHQTKTSVTQVNNELTKFKGGFSTKSHYIQDFFPVYYNMTVIVKLIVSGIDFIISLVLE